MKKSIALLATFAILISGCSDKTKSAKSKFIKVADSRYKIDKTIEVISQALKNENYTITRVFDHEKEAIKLKQMLYPTKTFELYNPKIATKLIQCNPSISLELPLRLTVYNELNGQTHVAYTDPEYWSLKHNVKDGKCINLLLLTKRDLAQAVSKVEKADETK